MFDIQTTATIIERKAHTAPVTSLLFARSTSFPAVRSAHDVHPQWFDPPYNSSPDASGTGGGPGVGMGTGAGMGDMFDLSADRPMHRSSGVSYNNSGKSDTHCTQSGSTAGHLLLFSSGTVWG